jgi:hypothetical protein
LCPTASPNPFPRAQRARAQARPKRFPAFPDNFLGSQARGRGQLDRLRELPRRHRDLVPARPELAGQRAEEGHVRRVRKVDPDEHQGKMMNAECGMMN